MMKLDDFTNKTKRKVKIKSFHEIEQNGYPRVIIHGDLISTHGSGNQSVELLDINNLYDYLDLAKWFEASEIQVKSKEK